MITTETYKAGYKDIWSYTENCSENNEEKTQRQMSKRHFPLKKQETEDAKGNNEDTAKDNEKKKEVVDNSDG